MFLCEFRSSLSKIRRIGVNVNTFSVLFYLFLCYYIPTEVIAMEKVVAEFGNFIKEKRIAKGYSQAEMAKKLSISQQAYCRYELGTREAGLQMILDIAEILDFKPGEFFNKYI